MEVTVTKLRLNGKKLSQEELATAERFHGFVEISYWTLADGKGPPRQIKELILKPSPTATCRPTLTLRSPDQTRLKGDDMVYTGTEKLGDQLVPQAWWVRLDQRQP